MKIKLAVTRDLIEAGTPNDNEHCPIALALHEATDMRVEADYAYINMVSAGSIHGEDEWHIKTPPELERFMQDFDQAKPVEPFECELEFVEGYQPTTEDSFDD